MKSLIIMSAKSMGFEKEGQLAILIHCGSRGFGHQVCSDYLKISEGALKKYDINIPDRELACVPYQSSEGKAYLKGMFSALNFAWSNRQIITHWVRKTFEKVLKLSENDLNMQVVYDVSHNIAKVESHKVDDRGLCDLVVHRKGATRAFSLGMNEIPSKYRNLGQPVIIPGSMGTASWLLLGNGKSEYLSFGSTAHGAGRAMSNIGGKKKLYGGQCKEKPRIKRDLHKISNKGWNSRRISLCIQGCRLCSQCVDTHLV